MEISFDVSNLANNQITGVGVYTKHLFTALQSTFKNIFIKPLFKISRLKSKQTIEKHLHTPCGMYVPEMAYFYFNNNNILHMPDCNRVPTCRKNPVVLTLHDMFFHQSSWVHPASAQKYLQLEKQIFVHAKPDHVICVSKFTQDEFLKYYPQYEGKTSMIYHGIDHLRNTAPSDFFAHPASGKPYLLYVGTVEYRKNIDKLIEAFEIFNQENTDFQIVIIGKKGFGGDDLVRKIYQSTASKNIVYEGFVPSSKLFQYYAGASAFVYVSHYEGFGFPILEAMLAGLPTVTSNRGAMAEIAGSHGLLCDVSSSESIAAQMSKVVKMKKNDDYKAYAQTFTWQKCAENTLKVYELLA